MATVIVTTVLLLLVVIAYAGRCWISPFGDCRRCEGIGYSLKEDRHGQMKRGKPCRRCRTTGKRLRIGRRIHNTARAVHDAGTR